MAENYNINAILEDDLSNILSHYKLLDKIKNGDVKCCNCNGLINLTNILSINIENGKLSFQCSSDECGDLINS